MAGRRAQNAQNEGASRVVEEVGEIEQILNDLWHEQSKIDEERRWCRDEATAREERLSAFREQIQRNSLTSRERDDLGDWKNMVVNGLLQRRIAR